MKIHSSKQQQQTLISLEGELTIYNVNDLRAELLSVVNNADDIEINLSLVSDVDSAGLQLLMLVKREMLKQEKNLRLVAHSRAVLDAFELCDLGSFFGDPLLISGSTMDNATNNRSAL